MRKLGLPRYYGSKLGKLVKVIAVDDLHSWSELHKSTMFTDRELNYYIAQLFNDKVLYKRNKQYFIDSNLANEYKEYYNCRAVKPETKQYNEKIRQENLAEKEEILKTSGRNQKIVVRPQIYIAILIGFALVTGLIYANNTNGFFNSQLPTPKPNPESIPDLPSEPSTTEPDSDTPIPSPETETEPQSEPETPPTPETPHEESNPESETPPESNPEPPSEPDDTPTIPKTPPQEPESKPQPSPEPKSTIQISIIAKCTKIYDGDTFEISNGEVIRLADIDCPEANETGYESSKNALIDLIYSKTVYLDLDDKHGTTMEGQGDRYVCVVYLKDGSNINLKLLKSGYASYDDHDNEFNPNTWSDDNNLDLSKAGDLRDKDQKTDPEPSPELEPEPEPETPPEEIEPESPEEPEPDPHEEWLNEGPFWGSKNSNKYHKPSCYWAKQIKPENLIIFKTRREAINKGYVACKVCKP